MNTDIWCWPPPGPRSEYRVNLSKALGQPDVFPKEIAKTKSEFNDKIINECFNEFLVGVQVDLAAISTSSRKLVYFIREMPHGGIKIGTCNSVNKRLLVMQTGNSRELKVVATMKGGFKKEKQLHKHFKYCRIRGEWFSPAPELIDLIDRLARASFYAHGVRVKPNQ